MYTTRLSTPPVVTLKLHSWPGGQSRSKTAGGARTHVRAVRGQLHFLPSDACALAEAAAADRTPTATSCPRSATALARWHARPRLFRAGDKPAQITRRSPLLCAGLICRLHQAIQDITSFFDLSSRHAEAHKSAVDGKHTGTSDARVSQVIASTKSIYQQLSDTQRALISVPSSWPQACVHHMRRRCGVAVCVRVQDEELQKPERRLTTEEKRKRREKAAALREKATQVRLTRSRASACLPGDSLAFARCLPSCSAYLHASGKGIKPKE
jgi:hypothetical protein